MLLRGWLTLILMEETQAQALFCSCGRNFYQTGALANHRHSCKGAKRKVETALQGMTQEIWKKRKKTALTQISSSIQADSEPAAAPSETHVRGTTNPPESLFVSDAPIIQDLSMSEAGPVPVSYSNTFTETAT